MNEQDRDVTEDHGMCNKSAEWQVPKTPWVASSDENRQLNAKLCPPTRKTSCDTLSTNHIGDDNFPSIGEVSKRHICDGCPTLSEVVRTSKSQPIRRSSDEQGSTSINATSQAKVAGRGSILELRPKAMSHKQPESSQSSHHRQQSPGSKQVQNLVSNCSAQGERSSEATTHLLPKEIVLMVSNPPVSPLRNPRMNMRRTTVIKAIPASLCCPGGRDHKTDLNMDDSFGQLYCDLSSVGRDHSHAESSYHARSVAPPRPPCRSDSGDFASHIYPSRSIESSRDEAKQSMCESNAKSHPTEFRTATTRSRWSTSCGPYSSMESSTSSKSDVDDAIWPVQLDLKRAPRRFSIDLGVALPDSNVGRKPRRFSLGNENCIAKASKMSSIGQDEIILEIGNLSCDELSDDNSRASRGPERRDRWPCEQTKSQVERSSTTTVTKLCNQDLHSEQALKRCSSSNHSILLMFQAMSD